MNIPKGAQSAPKKVKEEALKKWKEALNLPKSEIEDWWLETGSTSCSFCNHFRTSSPVHYEDQEIRFFSCSDCPLHDVDALTCCVEFTDVERAVEENDADGFYEAAGKLYNKINSLETLEEPLAPGGEI